VRLDAGLKLVKDRPDREIAFEVLERLLDCNQQQIILNPAVSFGSPAGFCGSATVARVQA
jgi:hypothetical protein